MYLKELEINGFKSFANKSSLKFDSPISAIVGPNGSGKSNIAEAFRFVLGEQSFKSMRGKRGEDLIFSGTNSAGKQSRASVKVFFDNSDKGLPIDFDEVTVERTVFRDGVNEYKINGSSVRLKDITELLASANVGSSGHHIISQGEADRILNTTPKERKTILEEALGLKIFEYKKNESQKKLEKTDENIKQVQSLRREIAPHIKFLKKQVEKIEEGKQIKLKLVDLYKEYFKRESLYLKYKKQELAHAIDEPKNRLNEIDKKISEYREIAEKEEQTELKGQIQTLQSDLSQINSEKSDLIRKQGQTEGELQSLEKLLSRQEVVKREQITIDQSDLESLEQKISEIHNSIERESDLMVLREKISQIVSLISGFIKSQNGEDEANQQNKELLSEIETVKGKLSEIVSEIEVVNQRESELQQKLSQMREQLESDKTDSLVAEKEIIKLMTEKNELQQIISKHSVEIHNFNQDEANFKQELMEAHTISGREALDYENIEFKEGDLHVQEKEIAEEERQKQLDRKREIDRLKIKVEEFGSGSGEEIIREYEESNERDKFLLSEIEDLEKSAESLKQLITELEEKISQKFHEGIEKINSEFQRFFALMFGGGTASIRVVKIKNRVRRDTDLDFGQDEIPEEEKQEEGLEVDVSLPRKKVKGLMMLSGGERALTSIALIFAMSQVNPPPFIILDETDAALDEANSRKYGDMIENLSGHSQLILITHNRETMGRAGVLYGVTMMQGISKLLSINFEDGIEWAK
ncbi:AAA family ATPase [Candidatus Parcubacteria bacterium]|nr:AAA family ATPase [Candidatus Parcubacteria bacterium]